MQGGRGKGKGRGGRGRGRGRGRGAGRGQPQQQRQLLPQHYLNVLNVYNTHRMLSYLDETERITLGEAYPEFKTIQQQREQQRARMQKMAEQAREGRLKNGVFDTVPIAKILEEEAAKNKKNEDLLEEKKEDDEAGENNQDEEASEETTEEDEAGEDNVKPEDNEAAKVAKQTKKDNIANAGDGVSDPNTLLARLNSKRLYRRIKLLRKGNAKLELKDIYTFGMSSEQLAMYEWERLLQSYKEMKTREIRLRKLSQEGIEPTEEDLKITYPSPIPSSAELLLFSPIQRPVAILASYPRSGNSLLRNLYEKLTLRVTGSDMRGGLTKHDMVGEAATHTNSVQFVKTHFPERLGTPPFKVDRAVLLVRNPYDAMESYFNLMTTNTHTTSLTEAQRAKAATAFAGMAKKEILVWRDFHEYWLQQRIPLMVIRYEDLIRYTDKVMHRVIQFVLEIKQMGSFWDYRLDHCIREEQIEKLGSYKPRSGGIGKALSKYPPELLQEINIGILPTMEK